MSCLAGLVGLAAVTSSDRLGGSGHTAQPTNSGGVGRAHGTTGGDSASKVCPCSIDPTLTIVPRDTFRVVADLDRDGVADTFGYRRDRPWHTVHAWFSRGDTTWTAQPGTELEHVFAALNREILASAHRDIPDSSEARRRYERFRIHSSNVEHAPVMVFGGRLVIMWFMEPFYPAGINTYDACGRLLSRYVHPGHLRALLPVERDGEPWIVFGGTNNILDAAAAARERRQRLNLPIVGAIPLGTDGLHPSFRTRVRPGSTFVGHELPYWIADRERNSQVVWLQSTELGWLEGTYEPGSTRSASPGTEPGFFRKALDSFWAARDTLAP